MASAAMDYLNAAVAGLDGAACGDLLIALGEVQAKLTAAHAALLYRFDAADAHDAEGYGSSSAWLAARPGCRRRPPGPRFARCANCVSARCSARRWPPGHHRRPRLHHRGLDPQAPRPDA